MTSPVCSRRTFLIGATAVSTAGLVAACGPGPTGFPEPAGPDGVLVALADVPVGGAVTATSRAGAPLLVSQPEEGVAVAFSAVCTHEGCGVVPDRRNTSRLTCPCHGSVFDAATGENLAGPAPRPLDQFPVEVRDGDVVEA